MHRSTRGLWSALLLLLGTALGAPSHARAAARLALDAGAPIDASSGAISARITADVIAPTGADYVRINCILGPWSSPEDQTRRGPSSLTWLETYDQVVDTLMRQGLQIYMLIGGEAVHSGAPTINSQAWIDDYTYNFVSIVDHFKDRVRIYESFNEPNDWAGGSSAQLQPYWFAAALQNVYLNVKYFNGHEGDSSWDVTLVSGPLFSHDQDNGASYLASVYEAGRSQLAWDWCHSTYGTYPLDGVGYHLYVAQGTTDAALVTNAMNGNLGAIYNQLTALEGSSTKKLWISELGWSSDAVGEQGQAENVTTGMNLLLKDSRIELATWFTTQDWPGGSWGLYRANGLSTGDQKAAYSAYYAVANGSSGGPHCDQRGSGSIPRSQALIAGGLALLAALRIGRRRAPDAR
jgi:hypothetical protein